MAQEEIFLWLPSFCSRGQAGGNAQRPQQPVLFPHRHPAAVLASDPAALWGIRWSWGARRVLGGLRRLWPVTPYTDLESWRPALCRSASVLQFWVGSRIKSQNLLHRSPWPLPPLLISVCCIFQPELVNELVLAWTGAQPEQFQPQLCLNCSKAKASRQGYGGSAEALHWWAQPVSFTPQSYWDFSKGKKR